MVSYLINAKTLLRIHFMSLFTKHLVQELTTQKSSFKIWSTNSIKVRNLKPARKRGSGNP